MSNKTLIQASREQYTIAGDCPTHQDIQTGAIQRIADATEAMAKRHTDLIRDNEWLSMEYRERGAEIERLRRSNASLRGVITKLKKKAEGV